MKVYSVVFDTIREVIVYDLECLLSLETLI